MNWRHNYTNWQTQLKNEKLYFTVVGKQHISYWSQTILANYYSSVDKTAEDCNHTGML